MNTVPVASMGSPDLDYAAHAEKFLSLSCFKSHQHTRGKAMLPSFKNSLEIQSQDTTTAL